MLQLQHIKARIIRLRELTEGLGREVKAWEGQESPLLPSERRQYLTGFRTALRRWTLRPSCWRGRR